MPQRYLPIAYSPIYCHPLPEGHRFPMLKYELIPEQLLYEGTITESQLFVPPLMSESDILSTHSSEYLEKLKSLSLSKSEERKTGFPLSDQLVERERIIMQGTLDASLKAIEMGVAMNIAGGTHHAYRDRGEGFCLLNDIALSANYLLNNSIKKQILVVDLDVHQGNGTASIFEKESRVFTFSMHGEHNYPLHKEKSDLDVGLPDGIEDTEYLQLLDFHLKKTIDLVQPDFIFYQCGVDILNTDKLGRLKVSSAGCKERDRMVFEQAKKNHIPMCCSMGGGYSEDIKVIVEAHCNTFRLASEIFF
jgi:acetoin utilization deacetylase AcuC-like enzyme